MRKYLTRRNVLVAGAGITGATVLANRKSDKSGPRDPYFLAMQSALAAFGAAGPTLVVDLARLNKNIDAMVAEIPDGVSHRLPSKSLPSQKLIDHVMRRAGTKGMMTFNWPMLAAITQSHPNVDQLIGKPLPVAAMRRYFATLPEAFADAAKNVQWLVDTHHRLGQYAALAESLGVDLRINLEIDVGLHRGGFDIGDNLKTVLEKIKRNDRLSFSGFMGYDPHVPSIPTALGMRTKSQKFAFDTYRAALAMAAELYDNATLGTITRNAAGSPSFRLYKDDIIANDLTVGSALVKPISFDTELLDIFEPACFIATPVLKTYDETRVPSLEFASGFQTFMNPNLDNAVFIYGGKWYAAPVDPPGLSEHPLFGASSNQAMLNGGKELDLVPDDFVFFRPKASEAVFLQFGDIAIYDGGKIVDTWPVFPASA